MDHLAGCTANCARVGRTESVPMDKSPGKECEPVIIFESLDLSVSAFLNNLVFQTR